MKQGQNENNDNNDNNDALVITLINKSVNSGGFWVARRQYLSNAINFAGNASEGVKAILLGECVKQGYIVESRTVAGMLGRKLMAPEVDCLAIKHAHTYGHGNDAVEAAGLGASQNMLDRLACWFATKKCDIGNDLGYALKIAMLGLSPAVLDNMVEISIQKSEPWLALEFGKLGASRSALEPLITMSIEQGLLPIVPGAAMLADRKLSDADIKQAIGNCLENCIIRDSDISSHDNHLFSSACRRINNSLEWLKQAEELFGRRVAAAEIDPIVSRLIMIRWLWWAKKVAELGASKEIVIELFRASAIAEEDGLNMAHGIANPKPPSPGNEWTLPRYVISKGLVNSLIQYALSHRCLSLAINIAKRFGTSGGMKRVIMRAAVRSGNHYRVEWAARLLGRPLNLTEAGRMIACWVRRCGEIPGAFAKIQYPPGCEHLRQEHTEKETSSAIDNCFDIARLLGTKSLDMPHSEKPVNFNNAVDSLIKLCVKGGRLSTAKCVTETFRRELTADETSALVATQIESEDIDNAIEAASIGGRGLSDNEIRQLNTVLADNSAA